MDQNVQESVCKPTNRNMTVAATCRHNIITKTHSWVNGLRRNVVVTRKACLQRNDTMNWRQSDLNGHAILHGPKCSRDCKTINRNTTVAALCHKNIVKTHNSVDGLTGSALIAIKRCLRRNDTINSRQSVLNGH